MGAEREEEESRSAEFNRDFGERQKREGL